MGAGYTLFLYVEGSDLHEVAPFLRARFQEFVERQEWVAHEVWFVEQTRPDERAGKTVVRAGRVVRGRGAEDLMFIGEGPVDIEHLRVLLGGEAHARH